MPEGDTIYRAARALAKALEGKPILAFDTALAHLARTDDDTPIVGRIVEKVKPRGKWLLIHLSGDLILVTHMLMSGSWHIYRTGEKWWMPRSKMRAVIEVEGFQAVAFNVPIAEFHTARSLARHPRIPALGPDILSEDFTTARGVEALRKHRQQHPQDEIGVALLNQRVMAGLGNVYKSEVPFAAGVNPFRPMSTLTDKELETMAEFSKRYMQANVSVETEGKRRTTNSMDREAPLGLRPSRRAVPPLRDADPDAQARRAGPLHLLVPRLPALDTVTRGQLHPTQKAPPPNLLTKEKPTDKENG